MKDLNEVLVFAHVAKERSFTRAASVLDLPKSSVSDRVARLEHRLGVRLLERTTRSLRLTPAGEAYFTRVARLMADLDDAESEAADSQKLPRGMLRIGASPTFAQLFLDDVIHEYLALYPDVSVELLAEARSFDVIEERLDLAIHFFGPLDGQLVSRRLGSATAWCVASPSYLAKRGMPSSPSELSAHACITGGMMFDGCWTFRRGADEIMIPITPRYMVTSLELVHRAALRGAGIAICPIALAGDDLDAGRLVHVLPEWKTTDKVISLVYPSRRHQALRTRKFIELVVERFEAYRKHVLKNTGRDAVNELVR